jgi:hypothetical protein
LRAAIGKGSPKEIFDEVEIVGMKEKIKPETWTDVLLRKFMCDSDIGIDCSGLAYYILAAENKARGKGSIDRHITFPNRGFFRGLAAKFRPVENTDVLTFSNNKNSMSIDMQKIEPGDFITMTANQETGQENKDKDKKNNFQEDASRQNKSGERNHIVVIHQVDYQNFVPTAIHYTHSIAWPDDGQYGHGVRQGVIEIFEPTRSLVEQKWTEKGKTGQENPTCVRAKISKTDIRRLKWL